MKITRNLTKLWKIKIRRLTICSKKSTTQRGSILKRKKTQTGSKRTMKASSKVFPILSNRSKI